MGEPMGSGKASSPEPAAPRMQEFSVKWVFFDPKQGEFIPNIRISNRILINKWLKID